MIDADHRCHTHASAASAHTPSRRTIVVALAAAAASSVPALAKSNASPADERLMRMALDEARQGDYAFGCVIARGDEVIARGPLAAAAASSVPALAKSNASPADERLMTSGEMGAIVWCGVGRLFFAASVPEIGRSMNQIMITSAEVAARTKWDPIKITGGVLADEAMALLKR